jgi:hypothetical protein
MDEGPVGPLARPGCPTRNQKDVRDGTDRLKPHVGPEGCMDIRAAREAVLQRKPGALAHAGAQATTIGLQAQVPIHKSRNGGYTSVAAAGGS